MNDYWWPSMKLPIVSKSEYLYIPIIVNQQVWGFQISMNYCRYTSVEAIHAFGLKKKIVIRMSSKEQTYQFM